VFENVPFGKYRSVAARGRCKEGTYIYILYINVGMGEEFDRFWKWGDEIRDGGIGGGVGRKSGMG
jgi:hypothetical protein